MKLYGSNNGDGNWGYTRLRGFRSNTSVPDRSSDRGTVVENGVKGGVVIHLELAIKLEAAVAGEDVRPEGVEAGSEVCTLFVQHREARLVAVLVIEGRAVKLLVGVEDLEGEDGEAVDDEARRLGVEGRGRVVGCELEEVDVDLLGEVVAELVEAIDVVLDADDGGVGGVGVASFVFAMPKIVVGAVLVEDKFGEWRGGDRGRGRGVVAVGSELVLKRDDVGGDKHEA
jgi:hypothetical protein